MKAESSVSSAARSSRTNVYSRPATKRVGSAIHPLSPSSGIQKSRQKGGSGSNSSSSSSLESARKISPASRSPTSRLQLELQRQRQQHLIALEREVRGLLEEEYREDVTAYMRQVEQYTMSSPTSMDLQPEIQWHMRACLVEFLIEVHLNFQLRPETLYLTCNIVDRYVSRRVVYKKHYQLVGCAALWIAAKFEDAKERVPTVRDLCEICRDEYDESAFIQMEGHVLATIAWRVGHPTAEAWLRLACVGVAFEEPRTQHVTRFLMEITLFFREFVAFPPSVIAQASLLLARYTLGKSRRAFEETEAVVTAIQLLDAHLAESLDQISEITVKKYSHCYYSKASTHIVHYYLQGKRYVYQPPVVPAPVPRPSLTPVPQTPASKMLPRVPQEWSSVSSMSSMSSVPSFAGSDISSEADESVGPQTPPPSSAHLPAMAIPTLEPLTLSSAAVASALAPVPSVQFMQPPQQQQQQQVSTAGHSSNKENRPVSGHGHRASSSENVFAMMQENTGNVNGGTRSRKSSLEVVQQNIPADVMMGMMDKCGLPMHTQSPKIVGMNGRMDQATYIPPQQPRSALNSLTSNNAGSAM